MSLQSAQQFVFGSWNNKPIEFRQIDEKLSSDGGLIAFSQLDRKLGWTESLASLISDPRSDPRHSAVSIVRQRVFGIVAGYEDQNDHDSLRSDPVFKLIADRSPDGDDLASQPTISRLENSVTAGDLLKMQDWFIGRFVESFAEEPAEITLDIDTFDDPAHGHQQLVLFHGFYNQYQYQVRAITCANNDMVVLPSLLFGSAHASLGAADDLRRVIEKLRRRFPHVTVHVRADSGFAVPEMYDTLESMSDVIYSIGYQMNSRVKRESDQLCGCDPFSFARHIRILAERPAGAIPSGSSNRQRSHSAFTGQRGRVGIDRPTAAKLPVAGLSGEKLAAFPQRGRQVRSSVGRNQSPRGGHQSARRERLSRRCLRRIRRSWRERKP